jgi:lipid II:glycine glycyltransferase (peptidoglycan interpeptide bridge formation enzyme)
LFPLVAMKRQLRSLSMLLGMPLGLEGTPIMLTGALDAGHVEAFFNASRDHGAVAIYGGAGGSPPAVGKVTHMETHVLDLSAGFEAVWNGSFTAKNRNVCRKADKAGVVVADETATGGDDYYALYESIAEGWDRDALPKELFEALLASGSAELWMARLDGRPAAGALLLRGSSDLLYWSGAMNREFGSLAPSNAVLKTAVESACERGIDYLDFGASAGLPGVESFKRSFGATARDYIGIELSSRRHRGLESARRRLQRR